MPPKQKIIWILTGIGSLVLGLVVRLQKDQAALPLAAKIPDLEAQDGPRVEGRDLAPQVLTLTKEQGIHAGLVVTKAGPGHLKEIRTFPGEVKLDAEAVAHIYPRFAGIVREVKKSVGDQVKKGETLAIIESNESLKNYPMQSLLSGTIISRDIALGEMLREDTECFVIANLDHVWIDLNIYPRDLPLIQVGDPTRIRATHHNHTVDGTISYIGPTVNEHTRTALARVILANHDHIWRPGIFVTGEVTVGSAEVPLVVSRSAVQTIDGVTSVFVEESEGTYRPHPVTLGRQNRDDVEIVSGPKAGTPYVTSGAFILKAEWLKTRAQETSK